MGVVIKQSFWISVVGYLGVIVGYVNTIILRPQFMTEDEIGLFTLVISNAVMFAPVVSLGMPGAYIRLVHYVKDNKKGKEQLFTFQLVILLVSNLALMLLVWLLLPWIKSAFLENSPAYNEYIFVSMFILLFYSLFLQLNAYSRVELNVVVPEFLKNIFLRLGTAVLIIMFGLRWIDLDLTIQLLIVIYMLTFMLNLYYLFRRYDLHLTKDFLRFKGEPRKELFRFGGNLVLISLGGAIANNIFFLLISILIGTGANGIFTTCFYIATVIEMPKRSMTQILIPVFAKEFRNDNLPEINKLYQKSSVTLGVFAMLLLLGVICNLDDLFNLIPNGSVFREGAMVVIWVSAAKVIDMVFGFNSEIINYSKDYRYLILFSLLQAALTVIFCYIMIPAYGINGAAAAFFISMLLYNVAKFIFLKKRFNISPFTRGHIALQAVSMVTYLICVYLPLDFGAVIDILIRSVFITVVFSISVYSLKISPDINNLAHTILKRVF